MTSMKMVGYVVMATAGWAVLASLPDIKRYWRIYNM